MKTLLTFVLAIVTIGTADSSPLKPTDPEYTQLSAMGYDISDLEEGSIAERNDTRLWIMKSAANTFVARTFVTDPKKVERSEYKVLQILNKLNLDLPYTLALSADKESLICGQYYRGTHERKSFGATISELERCNIIFDLQPSLLEIGE